MHILHYTYHLTLLIAACASIAPRRPIVGIVYLRLFLITGLITELVFNYFLDLTTPHFWLYNLYLPFECVLLVFYYLAVNSNRRFQRLARGALLLFFLFLAVYYLTDVSRVHDMPTLVYNVHVMIQVVLATVTLVFIEPEDETPIFGRGEFWILSAVIIFFSGVFVFNGVASLGNSATYYYLQDTLIKGLNILLYLTITTVLLWKTSIQR